MATKQPKFSPSKEKWVQKFKSTHIKGEPLKPNVAIENKTVKKSENLTNAMIKDYDKEIKKLFKKDSPAYFATDASIASQSRILLSALFNKWSKIFANQGVGIMTTMTNEVNNYTKSTVSNSLKKMMGDVTINVKDLSAETKETLKAGTEQASMYIKSIQSDYHKDVSGYVYRSITEGEGLKDLVPNLQKLSGQTKRRTKNLALDQTRKANATLTKARLQQNNISKAVWRHSGGGKTVRSSHVDMDGKVFNINEGLYDYEVGRKVQVSELPNCKCFYVPVIEFD